MKIFDENIDMEFEMEIEEYEKYGLPGLRKPELRRQNACNFIQLNPLKRRADVSGIYSEGDDKKQSVKSVKKSKKRKIKQNPNSPIPARVLTIRVNEPLPCRSGRNLKLPNQSRLPRQTSTRRINGAFDRQRLEGLRRQQMMHEGFS